MVVSTWRAKIDSRPNIYGKSTVDIENNSTQLQNNNNRPSVYRISNNIKPPETTADIKECNTSNKKRFLYITQAQNTIHQEVQIGRPIEI